MWLKFGRYGERKPYTLGPFEHYYPGNSGPGAIGRKVALPGKTWVIHTRVRHLEKEGNWIRSSQENIKEGIREKGNVRLQRGGIKKRVFQRGDKKSGQREGGKRATISERSRTL